LLALAALLSWGVANARRGTVRLLWSPLYVPLALFLAMAAIQFWGHFTVDPFSTREALIKLLTSLLFFFLGGQLIAARAERAMHQFAALAAFLAFGLSLLALFQFFSSQGRIYWIVKSPGWTFGPYANHNHYAGLMEVLIPIAGLYAFSRPSVDRWRPLLGFMVLVPIASMLLSGSRGGLVALIVQVLLLAGVVIMRGPAIARRGVIVGGTSVILGASLLFLWADPGYISKRLASVAGLDESREPALGERSCVLKDTVKIFRDHPWMGTGLGTFASVYPAYRSFPSDLLWDHAHNDYVQVLAETGIAGGILVLASLALFFRLAFFQMRERLRHSAGWISLGAAVGCCGLLVHSFVDFNLHVPANALWFAMAASVAQADPRYFQGEALGSKQGGSHAAS